MSKVLQLRRLILLLFSATCWLSACSDSQPEKLNHKPALPEPYRLFIVNSQEWTIINSVEKSFVVPAHILRYDYDGQAIYGKIKPHRSKQYLIECDLYFYFDIATETLTCGEKAKRLQPSIETKPAS